MPIICIGTNINSQLALRYEVVKVVYKTTLLISGSVSASTAVDGKIPVYLLEDTLEIVFLSDDTEMGK